MRHTPAARTVRRPTDRALRVGLTGGIGAGKSTVAALLEAHGAVVTSADEISRDVVSPGSDGLAAVVAEFGEEILAPDGSLDRSARRAHGLLRRAASCAPGGDSSASHRC